MNMIITQERNKLIVLAEKIHDWDRNDITENNKIMLDSTTEDDDDDDSINFQQFGGYITRNDLMKKNKNHNKNVSNYCDNNNNMNNGPLLFYSYV